MTKYFDMKPESGLVEEAYFNRVNSGHYGMKESVTQKILWLQRMFESNNPTVTPGGRVSIITFLCRTKMKCGCIMNYRIEVPMDILDDTDVRVFYDFHKRRLEADIQEHLISHSSIGVSSVTVPEPEADDSPAITRVIRVTRRKNE